MAVQYSVKSARGGAETVEAVREIVDEIVDILKPRMDAHGRPGAPPWSGGAQLFGVARNYQTLEAAPGIAHAEKLHTVEHRLESQPRTGFEDDPEEPRGAAEVALPEVVSWMLRHGRMEDSFDLRTGSQPIGEREALLVVLFHAHRRGAQPTQCKVAI